MRRRTLSIVAVVGALLGGAVVIQGADLPLPGNHIGYEPVQPIAFSHPLHAGQLEIPCLYCHSAAERSRHAGLPSDAVCMNCHRAVGATLSAVQEEAERAKAARRQPLPVVSSEIAKLYRAQGLDDTGQPVPGARVTPIRWVRVHNLPDFAYFDHRSHVAVGVACETCHGPVDTMARVRQHADLTMGWCVNCHRRANATGLPGGRPARASTDCSTCHY
ncbi:MAG: hypothetical protein JNM10_12475 [Planctomycetia bacterium]|nr:hypothetical protein [Planctomycetia bacterium]